MHGLADKVGDKGRARLLVNLHGRAHLLDVTALQNDDIVGDLHGLILIMRDKDARDAELTNRPAEPAAQLLAHLRVDGRKGFVEQQQFRLRRERPRKGHALPLAARKLHRVTPAEFLEADQLDELIHARPDLRRRRFLHLQPEGDVFAHGHVAEQCVVLEHEADAALAGGDIVDAPPADEDIAAVRLLQPCNHAQDGGLARAGRAEQADEAPLFHGKIHIVRGLEMTKRLFDMLQLHFNRHA